MKNSKVNSCGNNLGEVFQQFLDFRQVDKSAGRQHAGASVIRLVKMSARRVDRDEIVRINRQCTFQKAIVRFVFNPVDFGQRKAQLKMFLNQREQFGFTGKHRGIFIKYRVRKPAFQSLLPAKPDNQIRRVVWIWKRGELQHAGIKNDFQDKAWPGAGPVPGALTPRNQSPPDPSSSFRRCACGLSPVPAAAGTGLISRQLWLVRT